MNCKQDIVIRAAEFPKDTDLVRTLFGEYAEGLGFDLAFQGFREELTGLPGKYASPAGRVLLAWLDGQAEGCVAIRPIDAGVCEMKRLYVRPAARGHRLGQRLVESICAQARASGYRRICLDTLPQMSAAAAIYRRFGFEPIEAYVFNPIPGARFLALDLADGSDCA